MSGGVRPLVTILAPVRDEAEHAVGLVGSFRQVRAVHPDLDFELVVVDDGSVDGTADLVSAALGAGDLARVARLSRHFGRHAAITAGLALCRGDCLLTVGTDLREPLAAVARFLAQWRAGADIVWGVRPTHPREKPSQVLVSRPVIDTVNARPERERDVLGDATWAGFTRHTIALDWSLRPARHTRTSWKKVRSFVEFCPTPYLVTMLAGLVLSVFGVLAGLTQTVVALTSGAGLTGWHVLPAVLFFLGGLQLGAIGGFGEYLWRIGDDTRQPPVYLLRSVRDVGDPARDSQPAGQGDYQIVGGEG